MGVRVRSGKLRHVIEIQEATDTPDGMGGFTKAWAAVTGMDKIRASIWPVRGQERVEAMKLELKSVFKIRMRYRDGVDSKNRIYWPDKAKTFNIIEVANMDERNIMVEYLVTERV